MNFPGYPFGQDKSSVMNFMYKVYGWMAIGLAITAGISFYVFKNPSIYEPVLKNPWMLFGLIILQFAIVIALSGFVLKMSFPIAVMMFVFYSIITGLTFSFLFQVYTETSIFSTFLITAGMFAATCLYGYFTKADLTSVGSFAFMALIGLILTGFVNMFLRSEMLSYIYSIIGVIVFTLLTAYDSQQIKAMAGKLMVYDGARNKIAIIGALTLYLDFINLFLFLLRFTGGKKEN